MEFGPLIVQAGLLICSAIAIALTTRNSLKLRRVGATIGVLGQAFWFIWLDPMKDFGAFALAVWFLGVYGRVLYETFQAPLKIFVVKVHFQNPDRNVSYSVLAPSDMEIFKTKEKAQLIVPCSFEVVERVQQIQKTVTTKELHDSLLYQQKIQQSEHVVPH